MAILLCEIDFIHKEKKSIYESEDKLIKLQKGKKFFLKYVLTHNFIMLFFHSTRAIFQQKQFQHKQLVLKGSVMIRKKFINTFSYRPITL